jgi:acyl-CoA reductase-like NAD-dependent aldehyde dehydrogenase
VGSAPVARLVEERAAKAGKRVQALGGAKNHMVVMRDAVIDETVKGIVGSAFGAAGQRCMAGSVVVTVGAAHDRLLPPLCAATQGLRVGDDAIAVVNASRSGNGASIFTESGAAVRRFRPVVEAGMVGVNIGVAAPVAFFPFSGWKDSFLEDLHAHGPDAVELYKRKKTVTSRFCWTGQGSGGYFVEC